MVVKFEEETVKTPDDGSEQIDTAEFVAGTDTRWSHW